MADKTVIRMARAIAGRTATGAVRLSTYSSMLGAHSGIAAAGSAGVRGVTSGRMLAAAMRESAHLLQASRAYSTRAGRPSVSEMQVAERAANANRVDPHAQAVYLDALLDYGMPVEVMRRVESGVFAVDASVADAYGAAIGRAAGLRDAHVTTLRRRLQAAWREASDLAVPQQVAAMQAVAGSDLHAARRISGFAGGHPAAVAAGSGALTGYVPVITMMPAHALGGMLAAHPAAAAHAGAFPAAATAAVAGAGTKDAAAAAGGGGAGGSPFLVEVIPSASQRKQGAVSALLSLVWGGALAYMIWNTMGGGEAKAADGKKGGISGLLGTGDTGEVEEAPSTRFTDVKGCDEAKEELQDVVAFLREPEKYRRLGAKVPRGILLTGPPGTGKTLLARAVAGEAGCKFYSKSASEFEEMLVGLGARRVRELFEAARKNSPAIIFIDEIDAVGGKRRSGGLGGQSAERQTLNQLLACMDGFEKHDNVIVIAATNLVDSLDPALVRPGRFDTTVTVAVPDVKGREEILKLYLGKIVSSGDVDIGLLAKATPGFTGAQIEAMVNSAALMAANRGADAVCMADFEEARDKVIMGPGRRSKVQKPETLKMTAYHEGGHTLVALLTPGAEPVHKVTILPRGQTGGATWSVPKDEDYHTKEGLIAYIDMCMGGRIGEEVLNGPENVTTGAGGDFQQATQAARQMVMRYGMSALGLTSYSGGDDMSPDKRAAIDAEVEKILQESYKRVQALLSKNKSKLDALATALLEHETLSGDECIAVIEGKPLAAPGKKGSSVKQQQRKKEPETSSASSAAAKAADAAKKGAQRPRLGGLFGSAPAAPAATPAAGAASPVDAAGAASAGAAAVAPAEAAAAAPAAAPAAADTTPGQRKTRWG